MAADQEKNVEPELVERELNLDDVEAIRRALATKRALGWVHAMGMVRRLQELQAEVEELRERLGLPPVEELRVPEIEERMAGAPRKS